MRHSIIYTYLTLTLASLPALSSCSSGDDDPGSHAGAGTTIRVTTDMAPGRYDKILPGEDPFMLMLWEDTAQLETPGTTGWTAPYLASESPQSVAFYRDFVYDLGVPYPALVGQILYATGYSPAISLIPTDNYRVLTYSVPEGTETGAGIKEAERTDFLGCDVWSDVFRGSVNDPFAQDKNRLYFRHLASKLVIYADRDPVTMESRQFVRKVKVTNLCMRIDGGEWTPLYAPTEFTWGPLDPAHDFSTAYASLLDEIKKIPGNTTVTSVPAAGYKASDVTQFAGPANASFVMQRRLADGTPASDRIPVKGMALDSCYIVSPLTTEGFPRKGKIELRMDISAEMSYDFPFPLPDDEADTTDSSTTDDMTFTRTWTDMTVNAIKVVDANGNVTDTNVDVFKPGNEYHVYIHFSRTGVNMVARELPWSYGGIHYIAIIGGDPAQSPAR